MITTMKDELLAAAVDSLGAQLISLKDASGKEYIWQRNPKVWSKSSPLLFPIIGNCRDNKVMIGGKEYEIPKHGFCREMDFRVTKVSSSEAVFEMHDSEATRKIYPFSFCLSLTYTLKDGALSMVYRVLNRDSRTMCYCIGAHPGFRCPLEETERFEDYGLEFECEETAGSMTYDLENLQFDPSLRVPRLQNSNFLPLNYELFRSDAIYFDHIKSRRVSVINRSTGRGVEVSYPGFQTVAFWTPYDAKAPFLCVEPWNGSGVCATEDDDFLHKNHVQLLEPGESKDYQMSIRVL